MSEQARLIGGRYRLDSILGAGGMSVVHRAYDVRLNRDVALKLLAPNLAADAVVAKRFAAEAVLVAAISHPNLVSILDVGDDLGDPYYVMELIEGCTLENRLRNGGPMPLAESATIALQVASGLDVLHQRGLVHRDVKPANILLGTDGVARLADFGLVRGVATGNTAPGMAVGTLAYIAPEILRGEEATPAADVYALGVAAYRMATGTLPYPAMHIAALVVAQESAPERPSAISPTVPETVDAPILAALGLAAGRPSAVAFGQSLVGAVMSAPAPERGSAPAPQRVSAPAPQRVSAPVVEPVPMLVLAPASAEVVSPALPGPAEADSSDTASTLVDSAVPLVAESPSTAHARRPARTSLLRGPMAAAAACLAIAVALAGSAALAFPTSQRAFQSGSGAPKVNLNAAAPPGAPGAPGVPADPGTATAPDPTRGPVAEPIARRPATPEAELALVRLDAPKETTPSNATGRRHDGKHHPAKTHPELQLKPKPDKHKPGKAGPGPVPDKHKHDKHKPDKEKPDKDKPDKDKDKDKDKGEKGDD